MLLISISSLLTMNTFGCHCDLCSDLIQQFVECFTYVSPSPVKWRILIEGGP